MTLYLKLAWRNIFRNKRRTFIAGTAIGIGLAALIYTDALIIGMKRNMIDSATASFLGEGQIHREGFQETFEVEKSIVNLADVSARLDAEPIVDRYAVRAMSFAMISSPANVSMISMVGIEPEKEQYLSQIDEALIDGGYFEGNNRRDIVIGSKLADLLEVGIGDRVVLTAAQAHTGDLAQEMFRISGIYHFNVAELDRGMAFIGLPMAQQMLNIGQNAHEIAVRFTSNEYGRDRSLPFWSEFSTDGNEAQGWVDLLPQLEAAFELSDFSTILVAIILFGVVALGIINTLFMSLYERMFEFGVMRAVGTRPLAMGRLILFEAAALAAISVVFGALLGLVVTWWSASVGIDYSGIEFAGVTFGELLYPELALMQFIKYPFWVFVFTVVIGLYPATYAARMSPARAMRESF